MNAPEHLTGNYSMCYHEEFPFCQKEHYWVWQNGIENTNAFEALCHFCDLTKKYIMQCKRNFEISIFSYIFLHI